MDTLELTFENAVLSLETMKHVEATGLPLSRLTDKNGRPRKKRPGFSAENWVKFGGHTAILASEPFGTNTKQLLLIINCSHFTDFAEMKDWLQLYLGLNAERLSEADIQRIDCCVDVLFPWDTLVQATHQHRCRREWTRDSGRRTITLGQFPLQTILYEKAVSPDSVDLFPECRRQELVAAKHSILCTRIEARFKRHKRPVTTFDQIPTLQYLNPFAHFKLQVADEQIVQELPLAKKDRVLAYQLRCSQVGAQEARRERNRQGHFQKNVGQYLKPLDINLTQAWKMRTDRFFGRESAENFGLIGTGMIERKMGET